MIRFGEIEGKKCSNNEAEKRLSFAAKETKALNELIKGGAAYAKGAKQNRRT